MLSAQPYSRDLLFTSPQQKTYPGSAREAAFLLGGIGTGNVSVGARGELRDWEIFNSPGKGNSLPNTFFAIRFKTDDAPAVARVLESKLQPPFSQSHGFHAHQLAGLPRFASSELSGEYPFATVKLIDSALPIDVTMVAFTPFIPLDTANSSIPGAVIRYNVRNTSNAPMDVTVCGSLINVAGLDRFETDAAHMPLLAGETTSQYRQESALRGLYYTTNLDATHPRFGNMALATTAQDVTVKPEWLAGGWWDGAQEFWDDFRTDGRLDPAPRYVAKGEIKQFQMKTGSLGICHRIAPGETHSFEFLLTWYIPNRAKSWSNKPCDCKAGTCATIRNHYATAFTDAWNAAQYLQENLPRLERLSREFHRAMFSGTLPGYVIEALADNITVLRSTTCFRIEDGTFLGWEGCWDGGGCCDGTCTHVWNYAQTLAFLFPDLERTMRRVEFVQETDDTGKMAFRNRSPLGEPRWEFHPAADGQLGDVVRLYREWLLSGDDQFLREMWPGASRALDFAFKYWDSEGDCVLDSQQHNTYDIEFYGPNSLTNSMFFAALKAGAAMAEHLGDAPHATRYAEALEKGASRMDQILWGGEYYIQQIDNVDEYRYQYGKGCLSDQLLGQFMAHVVGLGYVLPPQHVRETVHSIFRHNFRASLTDHESVQRTYALNDEAGLLLCSWPNGGRPLQPFTYSDEVWTGIEYQVAAHLIYEGFVEEGLTIVRAVRDRHDGIRRNPWNEVECGHHYARSMASWAVLLALSGFRIDRATGQSSFAPVITPDNFSCFYCDGRSWGIYSQQRNGISGKTVPVKEVIYTA